MPKNIIVKKRITKMLEDKPMTTGQIYTAIHNYKNKKGQKAKNGFLTTNQLQMVLSGNFAKAGFDDRARQTIWRNRK